eukprot:scaffold3176_cov817-Pavlova_lutheri.AAC.1
MSVRVEAVLRPIHSDPCEKISMGKTHDHHVPFHPVRPDARSRPESIVGVRASVASPFPWCRLALSSVPARDVR